MDAFLILPVGVKSLPADCIHNVHSFFIRALKGLFTDTSRGCSWLFSPTGITAIWVFKSTATTFALCVTWALKWSKTSKAVFLSNPPGLCDQTLLNQIFMPSSFLHPFCCMWTKTPLGVFSFINVFLLKMIMVVALSHLYNRLEQQ